MTRGVPKDRVIRPLLPHPSDPALMLVPLSQGLFATVDRVDAVIVGQHNWYAHKGTRTYYAVTMANINDVREHLYMQVVIASAMGLRLDPMIDHWDRDGLNNRRINLRTADEIGNHANSRLRNDSLSGYKGVSKYRGKWRAVIRFARKQFTIGYFKSPVEAAKAYNDKAVELFGEFASLNNV